MTTSIRTCPLCEATCGLEIELEGDRVASVRPDHDDVFSKGFICPKGVSIKELHEDPDRVRTPLIKQPDGTFAQATWEEAFAEIDRRLTPLLEEHGRQAAAIYLGNPSAHNLSAILYGRVFLKALGTKNVFSASTVDQMPKQVAAAHMFGTELSVPVPDVDRTDFLLILGANPLASNGSLMTAPGMRHRLQAIQDRGGRVVVVDPRRSRTAQVADEHLFIRPGTDALLLAALVHTVFDEGLEDLGRAAPYAAGLDELREAVDPFTAEAVAGPTGIDADRIRALARELAGTPRAAVYGRIGTTTQRFGTVASWLVDALMTVTGHLDAEGGGMFPLTAAGSLNAGPQKPGRGAKVGRWASRVRGLPETLGELPAATLAEEMDTPGDGQIRALFTIAGNPASSLPNSGRFTRALAGLDLMVSLDIYVNETTRHADVILPAPSALEHSHYDLALYAFAVRNVANYSPPTLPRPAGMPDEWETLLRLALIAAGQGPDGDIAPLDDFVAEQLIERQGGDADALRAAVSGRRGPERLLDIMLRGGPYDLTLEALEAAPHGIDLGPLQPRLPDLLRTPSGKIELAPPALLAGVPALEAALAEQRNGGLLLVGRRHLRSNNSWMHNLPVLARGPERCTLQVHPDDASRLSLSDGATARVTSRTGTVTAPVEVTADVMPGVVSLPHGWGHDVEGTQMSVAAERPGTNSNVLADEELLEPITGTAVLNGIPVEVGAA
ncbi:molybdopterin-dependent oxidoreductase [Svornostia abyssi]|uniref:Molybdopterin-dependent oxidoreductase n=1 Tax=Svornostia abyssi TaxID=2898438 RepID=A0ABY5PGJ7_9ACTN|nr:molybdopterin-dependent oxidoreductase [Parviterribacteraceae bacterium J379]